MGKSRTEYLKLEVPEKIMVFVHLWHKSHEEWYIFFPCQVMQPKSHFTKTDWKYKYSDNRFGGCFAKFSKLPVTYKPVIEQPWSKTIYASLLWRAQVTMHPENTRYAWQACPSSKNGPQGRWASPEYGWKNTEVDRF